MTQILSHQAFSLRRVLLGGFFFLLAVQTAWAGGDPSDGHSHAPEEEAAPVVAVTGGATETEITLRLTDLTKGSASTPAPLKGALVEGTVKEAATGKTLGTITGEEEGTPGLYKIHFGDAKREAFGFPAPGRYQLAVNIEPEIGNGVETVIGFNLPAPPAPPATPVPLWRRVLPLGIGALALGVLLWAFLKWRRKRKAPPAAPVVTALLCLLLPIIALQVLPAWAHEGEVHEDEEEAATHAVTAPTTGAPNIAPGEVTVSTKAGNIGIALTAKTSSVATQTLAPGEVQLPAQTAQLLQIKTQPVQVAQLATGIDFNGQIAPNPNAIVRVASIVPGRVTKLLVAQGETVQQGETVAVIESRAVGEAQSAYQQALARFNNAQSNLSVVQKQAEAGVFSRAPVDAARQAQAQAAGEARQAQAAVSQARVAYENAVRTARAGGYASPALETARRQSAEATEAVRIAEAALTNAQASVESGEAELERRRRLASSGAYVARPVEEARRALVAAQSARAAAQSEVATTRANLQRARSLSSEGLVSKRDLESAEQAFETAQARLQTAQADETTASQELERQREIAGGNVAGIAEVQQAQSTLATAQADVRTRNAELQRARTNVRLSQSQLTREQRIFKENIANRREVGTAQANVKAAEAGLYGARRSLEVANSQLAREQSIFRKNLNNISNVQAARAGYVQAQADLRAARSTLALFKSSPGGGVSIPVRAPISGTVQTRDVALGELIQADAPILTIVNLDTVALEAQLFEADIARVRYGSPVKVSTQAVPNRTFEGQISFIGSQVSEQTRTVTARAIIRRATIASKSKAAYSRANGLLPKAERPCAPRRRAAFDGVLKIHTKHF
jgi:multidrug resistance efflux pump